MIEVLDLGSWVDSREKEVVFGYSRGASAGV